MTLFRRFLPTFEKPVARPRHIHMEEDSREFGGVAVVLLLAASCGVGLALWEPSQQITSPFVTASAPPPAAPASTVAPASTAAPTSAKAPEPETTATAADVDDDQAAPTVKLSSQCAQRTTARRDCANAKAFKDARVNAPEPATPAPTPPAARTPQPVGSITREPAPAKQSAPARDAAPAKAVASAKESAGAAQTAAIVAQPAVPKPLAVARDNDHPIPPAAIPDQPEPAVAAAPAVAPAAQPQRTAAAPKAKRQRTEQRDRDDDGPVERLVRVGERVLPDGRRVSVYRRSNGSYEVGSIVDGEYRPTRRTEAGARYFGLQ